VAAAQWSFRNTGTTGTLTSQAETGVWVQAPAALSRGSGGISSREKISILWWQNPAVQCILAFLNTLTQWERRSSAFRQLFNNGKGVPTPPPPEMSPAATQCQRNHRYVDVAWFVCCSSTSDEVPPAVADRRRRNSNSTSHRSTNRSPVPRHCRRYEQPGWPVC